MTESSLYARSRLSLILTLAVIFILGLLVRLIDLTDPPLDFNPTRQLRSAIIARGLYYKNAPDIDPDRRELALSYLGAMERLEPPILEHIVAFTYRLVGGEYLWVARIYTSFFWLAGAAALYALACRMTSPLGALVGVGYFLFLPFSIRASRSFQPDPGMTMFILLTAWALFRWSEARSWKWALLVGFFGGMAALVKVVGAFFVGGMAIGVVFYTLGVEGNPQWRLTNLKSGIRSSQVWVMTGLMIVPSVIYYLMGIGEQASGYFTNWTIISRWRDALSPSFYMRWMIRVDDILILGLVLAGFVGTLVVAPRARALLWGFWGGYALFGFTFPYHIVTHDYYHLPLVGLVALSLTPLAGLVIDQVAQHGRAVQAAMAGVILLFMAYNAWIGRAILVGQDFSQHPAYWQDVGEAIPADAKAIGLTQDYGARLMYYGWRKIILWPRGGDSEDFEARAGDAEFFVITSKNQLSDDLRTYLETHYPVHARGEGYIIYDLKP